jgi:hypothetical protein
VVNTTGAIGYANLGDARAKYKSGGAYHWLAVQNETNNEFEEPGTATGEPSETTAEANCEGTNYVKIPAYGANDNWSETNGAHPKKNAHYPICTLTYDIALGNYELAKFPKPAEEGMAAMEYLEYVASEEGGQAALKNHDYKKVEEAVGKLAAEESKLVNLRPR